MRKSIKVDLIDSKGEVQYGLNWGQRAGRNHDQAYIQLPADIYKSDFFPPKGKYFVVRTDDGQTIIMTRAQKTDDGTAIQTPDDNSILGKYFRKRLGLQEGVPITAYDIAAYGRNNVVITKIDNLNYEMNFSNGVNEHKPTGEDKPLQLIYYGAPGTGKSFTIDQVTNENNSVRTTFHPDSDYANFVGAYKPTMELIDIAFTTSDGKVKFAKPDKNEDGRLHTGKERKIVYKYVPQAFLKAYVEAWKRYSVGEDNPYYLVIEEINRGNCAQIFGDLFQLLDRNNMGCSSYDISADEDIAQFLSEDKKGFAERSSEDGEGLTKEQRDNIAAFVLKKDNGTEEHIGPSILNGSKLLLPPNLRIWATMNTSDQSLFPIDSAFKRRWNWEYMPIEYNPIDKNTGKPLSWKLKVGGKIYSWGKFLKIINEKIEDVTVSEDKQMGYFFAKPDEKSEENLAEYDTISENVFVNKVLFYLWTDVLKDYDLSQKPFIYKTKNKEGKDVNKAFSFRNFFPIQDNKFLADFMANLEELGLDPISADKPQSTDELEEEQDIEDNDDTSNLRLTIKFPNGKTIQEPTRFESYLKALEEIGLDRVEPIAAEKKYQRRNAPLVSKIKSSEIEADPVYTYVQSGDYYIVKGTNTRTQCNLLNLVSDKLNLGLEVSVE